MLTQRLATGLTSLGLGSLLAAQVTWCSPLLRAGQGMAAGPGRAVVVLFGGEGPAGTHWNDTWEFGSNGWVEKFPDTRPPALTNAPLAYWSNGNDSHIMLFGGLSVGGRTRTTWMWSGTDWTLVPPAAAPSARDDHALAFDVWRQRVVLFGGLTGLGADGQTWEWDGTNWLQRTPTTSPPPRFGHAMAFDPVNRRLVLFGGNGSRFDTWEFDSAANVWIPRVTAPANTPPGRMHAAMTYDITSSRVVLFGGEASGGALNDTWIWEPTLQPSPGWVRQNPATSPPVRTGHRLVYDSTPTGQGLVLVGGKVPGGGPIGDSWRWVGGNWVQDAKPPVRNLSPLAFDSRRGVGVMFGGHVGAGNALGDTWEIRGGVWHAMAPAGRPPARYGHGLAHMASRNRTILFGGDCGGAGGRLNDTWEWDGTNWQQVFPATPPSPRRALVMVYDSRRDRIVLFGGETCGGSCWANDTWEFDGTNWSQVATVTAPPPSSWGWGYQSGMAYDDSRGRAVLYGVNGTSELWEYDPTVATGMWILVPQATRPPVGHGQLAYDKLRRRTVFFAATGETWEWDGADWTQRSPSCLPPPRWWGSMVYNETGENIVLFGGGASGLDPSFNDTWFLRSNDPATVARYGTACRGTAGTPSLDAGPNQRPWIGDFFQVTGTGLVPQGASLLFLGLDRDNWNGIPLSYPNGFPLLLMGMPGCNLLAGGEVVLPMLHSGTGTATIPVPLNPSLFALHFYLQLFSFDRGANAFGATTSNGLNCRIGGR